MLRHDTRPYCNMPLLRNIINTLNNYSLRGKQKRNEVLILGTEWQARKKKILSIDPFQWSCDTVCRSSSLLYFSLLHITPTAGALLARPHCRRKVRLSLLSRRFLRQSHFSATVWTGLMTRESRDTWWRGWACLHGRKDSSRSTLSSPTWRHCMRCILLLGTIGRLLNNAAARVIPRTVVPCDERAMSNRSDRTTDLMATYTISGVTRVWCREGHETKRK